MRYFKRFALADKFLRNNGMQIRHYEINISLDRGFFFYENVVFSKLYFYFAELLYRTVFDAPQ